MENQNYTPVFVNTKIGDTPIAQAAETKTKRSYHRLTDEENARRAKDFEAYKAVVAKLGLRK